jgi:two-component system response regulator YesN
MREFALKAPGWKKAIASSIFEVLLYIIRHHGKLFQLPVEKNIHKDLPRLLPALEYVNNHFSDPDLSIHDLSKQVNVSEVYVRKLFHLVTGLSPIQFIQNRRIEKACMILKSSNLSIKEIAEQTGFAELPFFYKVFKHWTRVTPAQFRETISH